MPAPARIKLRDLTELLEWDPDLILLAENQAGMAYKIKGSLIPGSGGGGSSGDPSSYDIINAIPVANQAARLALTPDEARNALVRESDTGISYMLVAGGDPAFLADWLKVSDITPAIEDVVGLTTALSSIGTQLGTKERAVAQALADAGTIQWNMANGNIAIVTIGGNRNLANPTNVTAGRYTLKVKQDGTGNRNLNFAGNYVFPNGPLALSTAPNQETVIQFVAPGDGKLYHEGIPRIGSYNLTKLQKEQSAININAVQWNQIQLSEYTSPFPSPGHAYYNLDRPFQYVTTATYEDDHVELRLDVGCAAVILNDTSWGGNNVLVRGGGNELLVTIPKGRTGFAWYGEESGGMGGFLFPESDGEGIVLDTRDPVDSTPGEPQQQVGLATFSEGPVNGAGDIDIVVTDAVMDTGPLPFVVAVDEPLADLAGRVRALFEATAAITARYAVGGSGAEVTLTRLVPAPNDPTLAVDFDWLGEAGVAISFTTVTPGQDTLWRTMIVTGLDPEHGMNGRYVETAELSEGYPVFQRSPGRKIWRDSGYWVISRDHFGLSWYSPGSHNATHPGGHDDFEPLGGLATGTATVTGRAPDEAEPGTRWINTHDARAWTQAGETAKWVEDLRPLVEDEIARLDAEIADMAADTPFLSNEENVFTGQQRSPNQTAATGDALMTRALVEKFLLSQRVIEDAFEGWGSTVAGGATITTTTYRPSVILLSGTSAGATALFASATGYSPWRYGKIGQATSILRWSTPVILSSRFTLLHGASDAQAVAILRFGEARTSTTVGELTVKGIGLKIEGYALKGMVHDGTSLTVTSTLATLADYVPYEVSIHSDGAGNVAFHLNGALVGTTTGGPTGGAQSANNQQLSWSLTNGTSAAQRQIYVQPLLIFHP